MTTFSVLIPARYGSTRLPGKPLADLAGVPMVVHVARRARLSGAARVVIATDVDIPDPDADRVFADIRARITRGDEPDVAVAAVRAAHPNSWVSRIAVFE